MDAATAFTSARNPSPVRFSSASPSSRVPQRLCVGGPWRGRERRLRTLRPQSQVPAPGATAADASHHDVVVVGAGIVGLAIARHLLLHTPLSVAVADAAVPCSGATGAGQGYIWMSHRTPGSDTWELAMRSKRLWEELAAEVDGPGGGGAREMLGWMRTGRIMLVLLFCRLCLPVMRLLPSLQSSGFDATPATLYDSKCCADESKMLLSILLRKLASWQKFRGAGHIGGKDQVSTDISWFTFSYVRPITHIPQKEADFILCRSEVTGTVEAVQTSRNILYGRKAIVIASGAWTRSLLHSFLEPALTLDIPVKPRKGHLLVVEKFDKVKLNHGLMEVGYVNHEVTKSNSTHMASESREDEHGALSISMTATLDTKGNLVLGSSREFKGFSREVDKSVVKCIWERAREFFPAMKNVPLDIDQNPQIRIGHRPYMPDGKPVIGFIPDLPNVLIATGHEGSGLTLALGTAEMVTDMILGNPGKVDCSPFSIKHRFSGDF
ncbi:hypothetical protein BAE44_0016956, partial [Dichanthelium oligosanthes]